MKFNGKNIDFGYPVMSFNAGLKKPEFLSGSFVYLLSYYEHEDIDDGLGGVDTNYIGTSADRVVQMESKAFNGYIDCDAEIVLNPFVFLDLNDSQIKAMAKCIGIELNDICVEAYSVEDNYSES